MKELEIARWLNGKDDNSNQLSGRTRTYSAVALEDSSDGRVLVDLGGSVVTATGDQGIEIPCGPQVKQGDKVLVTTVNGSPYVSSVDGWGDYVGAQASFASAYVGALTAREITADKLTATAGYIDTLTSNNITTDKLTATTGYIDRLTSNSITTDKLTATSGYIDRLTSNNITTDKITATAGYIDTLTSNNITTDKLTATTGYIDRLTSNSITTDKLVADQGVIDNLSSTYATIDELHTRYADIDQLDAGYAKIVEGRITNAVIDQSHVENLSTHYAHIVDNVIDNATIDKANVNGLAATYATINELHSNYVTATNLASTYATINELHSDYITANNIASTYATINTLQSNYITANAIASTYATINELQSNYATIDTLESDYITADNIASTYATVNELQSNYATINELQSNYATIDTLESDYITADNIASTYATINTLQSNYITANAIASNYAQANFANVNNAWVENGVIRDSAITSAMILSLSADKLTAGEIDARDIRVTNLNADNITTGTINGQLVGQGSLSLDKLEEDVYTEAEVNTIVEGLNDRIDGAIETFTGTVVPTLNNAPANEWTTTKLRDQHVGDVYYVVNSESQQSGYCYRFTKSGNSYSWQLIKDSDVTAALGRLQTAEGKIGDIETFDTNISKWKVDTDESLTEMRSAHTDLVTRVETAEGTLTTKVDQTTYNNLESTVNGHTTTIGSLTTTTQTLRTDVNSAQSAASAAQTTANSAIKSSVQLWYSKANTTAPDKPDAHVTSASTAGGDWRTVVPTYNASYPYYYYCYEYLYADGTYGWSAVIYDRATTESQQQGRKGVADAAAAQSTANGAVTTANSAKSTAEGASADAATAVETANTASSNASNAVTTANTANTNASNAVTTANTANTNASNAVTTANTANTNASNAVTTANTANTNASNALNAAKSKYATSSTVASQAAKEASCSNFSLFSGADIYVKFTNANTAANPTLNVNNTGAKTILAADGSALDEASYWKAGETVHFAYNGSAWLAIESSAQEAASAVAAEVVTVKNSLNSVTDTVTEHTRKIGSLESTVATKADGSTVETIQNNLTSVTQDLSGFKTTVSSTYSTKAQLSDAIDSIEVGGRNLALLTGTPVSYSSTSVVPYELSSELRECEPNDLLTLSLDAKSTKTQWIDLYYRETRSGGSHATNPFFPSFYINAVDTWLHFTWSGEAGSYASVANWLVVRSNATEHASATTQGTVEIRNLKLEKGNKATDWTPAPEDMATSDEVEAAQTTANNALARAGMFKINMAERSFTTAQWKTYGVRGTATTWTTGSGYDNSKLRIGDTAYMTGTVTDGAGGTATIIGNITAINGTTSVILVSQQLIFGGDALDTTFSRVVQAETKIDQNDEAITLTAQKVDSLQIGGRNLFKNSAFIKSSNTNWNQSNASIGDDGIASISKASTGESRIWQMPSNGYWTWEPLSYYTVSVDARAIGGTGVISLNPVGANASPNNQSISTEWARYSYTFVSGDSVGTGSFSFYNASSVGTTIELRRPKLEKGNKATDWTPAPEDMATATELKVANDNISTKVSASGVISSINQSPESITIDANRVNIEGAAIFSSGRLSTTSLNNAYDAKGAADAIQIGGRNLALDTSEEASYSGTAYPIYALSSEIQKCETDDPITLSFDVMSTSAQWIDIYFRETKDSGSYAIDPFYPAFYIEESDVWTHFEWTGTAGVYAKQSTYVVVRSNATRHASASAQGTVTVRRFKLERGNRPTDWTPAPEDMATSDDIPTNVSQLTNDSDYATTTNVATAKSEAIAAAALDATNKVNAVQIGGRNLALGTTMDVESTIKNTTSAKVVFKTKYFSEELSEGDVVTISFLAKVEPETNVARIIPYVGALSSSGSGNSPSHAELSAVYLTSQWAQYSWTVILAKSADRAWITAGSKAPTDNNVYSFKGFKVERGNKATDWTPAPEDMATGADLANANGREQTIYYTSALPTDSVGVNNTWVINSSEIQNVWTTTRPRLSEDYPVLWIATQRQTVAQMSGTTCSCTTPVIDQTLTVIDGGHITTGTINAAVVDVINLDADEITTGTLSADRIAARSLSISKFSDLSVGGRNLIANSMGPFTSPASASGSAYIPVQYLTDHGDSITRNVDGIYTYSFDYEVTGNTASAAYVYPQVRGSVAANPLFGDTVTKSVYTEPSGHYSCRFKLTETQTTVTNKQVRIRLRSASDGAVLTVKNFKLEEGTMPTDWTPAPEDMATSAEIEAANDQIELRVKTELYNGAEMVSRINASASTVKIQAQHVEIDGSTVFKNTGGTTTTVQDYLNGNYDAKGAASEAVNNLTIGGRNLFKNSDFLNITGWVFENATLGNGVVTVTKGSDENCRIYQMPSNGYWSWEALTDYIVSIDARISSGESTGKINMNPVGANCDPRVFDITSTWTRYTYGFTSGTTPTTGSMSFYNVSNTGVQVEFRRPKLEKGNKATDWTPAPEDVDADISSVSTVANAAAPKASAVARTQRIYYRKTSLGSPGQNNTWLASSGNGYGNWSLNVPQLTYNNVKYPYLYTAVQTQTVAQQASGATTNNCSCSSPLLDDSTTIIDGGNIITGSIAANKLDAATVKSTFIDTATLNASQITSGTLSADRIAGGSLSISKLSDLSVGGRNLVGKFNCYFDEVYTGVGLTVKLEESGWISISGASTRSNDGVINLWFSGNTTVPLFDPGYYTVSVETNNFSLTGPSGNGYRIQIYMNQDGARYLTDSDLTLSREFPYGISRISLYISSSAQGVAVDGKVRIKLEKGTVPTDWTPAPEDMVTNASFDVQNGKIVASVQSLAAGNSTYTDPSGNSATSGIGTKIEQTANDITFRINSGMSYYATSTTEANVAAKSATTMRNTTRESELGVTFFQLVEGATVDVKFTKANTVANPTLSVDNTAAKPIRANGAALTADSIYNWSAETVVTFTYDGTYWNISNSPESAFIRMASSGLLVAKQSDTVGALVSSSGSFDVVPLTWSGNTPTVNPNNSSPLASFGSSSIKLGTSSGANMELGSSALTFKNGTTDIASFGSTIRIGQATTQRVAITENTVSIYDANNALAIKTNTSGVELYRGGSKRSALTANGLDVYGSDGTTSIASFGSTSRIGTTSGARVVTTSTGIDIYNSSNKKKASFGSEQYIYGGDGAVPYLKADANGLALYKTSTEYAVMGSSGLGVYNGGNAIAIFGATSRIGQSGKHNIYLGANAIDIYDANGALGQRIAAAGTTMYTAGTKRAEFKANGMALYATNGSTVSAEFLDSRISLGKNSSSSEIDMCSGNLNISYVDTDGAHISGLASKYGLTLESAPSGSYDNGNARASLQIAGRTAMFDHRDKSGNYSTLFQTSGHISAKTGGFNLQQGTSSKDVLMSSIFALMGAWSVGTDYHFIPIAGDKFLFVKQSSETFDITQSFGSMYYTTINNQGTTIFTTDNGKGPIYSLHISISSSNGLIWAMPVISSTRRSFNYRVISATSVTGRVCQVMIMGICGHANE